MAKLLAPIHDKDVYSIEVRKEIEDYIYSLVFRDLIDYLRKNLAVEIQNQKTTELRKAVESNRIVYTDGVFTGNFSSSISKELRDLGAKWRKRYKGFYLPLEKMPMELRASIATGTAKLASEQEAIKGILANTSKVAGEVTAVINFRDQLNKVFDNLDMNFVKTTADDITVEPKFTPKMREILIEKYNTNMDLYIKNWQEQAIVRLRTKVEKSMREGFRAESLAKIIENEFGATKKKAKFLALQETSLLVSKYRQERYSDAGVKKYRWSTSRDQRVRIDHQSLDGKIFSWDNPPITDRATGARNHPGEDFGCRCVPIPIID